MNTIGYQSCVWVRETSGSFLSNDSFLGIENTVANKRDNTIQYLP